MGKGRFRPQKGPTPEMLELEQSLQETQVLIAQAYAGFNSASDGELVESYIYEIQALQARYSYLLRRRKSLEPGGVLSAPLRGAVSGSPAAEAPIPLSANALEGPGSAVLPVA